MDEVEIAKYVVLVFVWICAAAAVSFYAESKGLRPFPYIVASLFLTPAVGFIAAAAAQPYHGPFKKCPDCAEAITAEAKKCRFCGRAFDDESIRRARKREPGDL